MKIDIHTHPCSSDSLLSLAALQKKAKDLTFAVTDHNTTRCLKKAKALSFIPGVEVSTKEGHLLLLFVEEMPSLPISVEEAVEFAHDHGGIAIAAHPFDPFRASIGVKAPDKLRLVDALELNQKAPAFANTQAVFVAKLLHKPLVAGSDAHFSAEAGLSYTEVEEPTPKALLQGKPVVGKQPLLLKTLRLPSRLLKALRL